MTYPWASLKPALYYFYVHKNLTLDEVRKKIEAKYGIVIQSVSGCFGYSGLRCLTEL